MPSKKWLAVLAAAAVLILGLYAGFNMLIDPFGVFGDPILDWYSYNETNNPRTAKLAWLEKHHDEFDSYILGSSSAASYRVDDFNRCLDARFYNLSVPGADAGDYRELAAYLLERCEVRHLVLSLDIRDAGAYNAGRSGLQSKSHALASGENPVLFYLQYAFADPRYAVDKLLARRTDTDLPQAFDRFDAPSGSYDRRLSDAERIGDMSVYEAAHREDFPIARDAARLPYIDQCVQAVAEIRDMCRAKGAELLVIVPPLYAGNGYSEDALRQFKDALAQATDYWDFSDTTLSHDSRYFYDAAHFRSAAGTMMLARISGSGSVWYPEGFGAYVTAENCSVQPNRPASAPPVTGAEGYTTDVPVLMFHHIDGNVTGDNVITPDAFECAIRTLSENGCSAVTVQEMIDYVYHGGSLPEKAVCITLDDGYLSNYEYAWPILERYGMRATIFVIGVSIGHKEFYKDTNHPLIPHFDWKEAREMAASGVIDIQSHTYDLHQWPPFETGSEIRSSALPLEGESEAAYAAVLQEDLARYETQRTAQLGGGFCALAYPSGLYNDLTEVLIHQAGIPVTLSTRADSRNVLVRGLPQSLYALCRWNITQQTTAQQLLDIVGGG